jgi:hypothetical protein
MSIKKSTEQYAIELLSKHGLILLGEYKGAHEDITFTCPNGHTNMGVATNILQRGYKCKQCVFGRTINPKISWGTSLIEKLQELVDQLTTLPELAKYFNTTESAIKNACDKFDISRNRQRESYANLIAALEIQNRVLVTTQDIYYGTNTLVEVCCSKGHKVSQEVNNIISKGTGCPKCFSAEGKSSAEKDLVKFILANYSGWNIVGDRTILEGKELDLVLPDLGLAFEFNGDYWHSDKFIDKTYHLEKTQKVEELDYQLIHVPEYLWQTKRGIWESRILNILGKTTNKIAARKCTISKVSFPAEFLDANHLQGAGAPTVINYALNYNNEIVAVMTFAKARFTNEHEYELVRFCSKLNTSIQGGANRLLVAFEKDFSPISIVSYANKQWSNGNVYSKLGFTHESDSPPGYYYAKRNSIISRYKAQKHKLEKLLKVYDATLTEYENMQLNGYHRVWDCGNQVWVKQQRLPLA